MNNIERNESYRNNYKAWKWFEAHGYAQHKGMVLHHKDTTMKTRDPERYRQWNVEDLEVMPLAEHRKMHMKKMMKGVPKTKRHRERISLGMQDRVVDKLILIDNGTVKKTFKSLAAAARWIGCSRQLVSQCVRETTNKRACGYTITIVECIDND